MAKGESYFLKKTLGDDFFESLAKVELWKPGTRTTIDHEEIKTALQIVPRVVMSLLIRELSPMNIGDTKDVYLPIQSAIMHVTKHERDVYSGDIQQDNKVIVDFKYRSLPGIGLIILSAFELYDINQISDKQHPDLREESSDSVQKLIDERIALHSLIERVVDKKIGEREAVSKLILLKLTEAMAEKQAPKELPAPIAVELPVKKGSPVKSFLENRKKKQEFSIHLAKGEKVDCPDCGKNIFDGNLFSGCICLGDDMERKVFINKSEDGIKVRFSKGWDQENIEMLLEVLRRKNG